MAVVGGKEVVPNLLQDLGKGCFVHFDKLLSQSLFKSNVSRRRLGNGMWMLLHHPLLVKKGGEP
ncbi:hypothetical protein SNOG_05101 [Parastagonospora nodorum SN15]|uniref:Uncharacterized protein n=1 Tax=Phaeosphaeria nodorum (strain SN15 / ATCC MYA-4574 / FGSC 10173) TaxID=321614 RepID=Q0UT13_PHANO|nr:hypothetical protein SNOG_05101 [Parastagonospora nodorum SN15]EAT87492.1 hypothetical protein SNOG_05101 [Parastagonospora nodorum SN15]